MCKNQHKAILVVSFGTSYEETRKKTIDVICEEIRQHFSDYQIYEAWTSNMIIHKVRERDGYQIATVKEALDQMLQDGITELIIQPTHIINGIENDIMKAEILARKDAFHTVSFGSPLLSDEADSFVVIDSIMAEIGELEKDTALILMGHGTTHYVNAVYAALDYQFKERGYERVFVGTVEKYPSLETLKKILKDKNYKKLILAPFMIVAGDHAKNDMASGNKESWRSQFEGEGYQVSCIMKGLGEYAGIRQLVISHIKEAI